jgi:hypothetical protein
MGSGVRTGGPRFSSTDRRSIGFKVLQTVQPSAIVDNKRLSAVLEQIKARQIAYPAR